MISQSKQRIISIALVGVAVGALVLGAIYQDDDRLDDPSFVGINQTSDDPTTGATTPSDGGDGTASATTLAGTDGSGPSPVERFLPEGGAAVACEEQVGVDLLPGYGARLTINGREVPDDVMDLVFDEDGKVIPGDKSAFRSIGFYTFTPDANCPNGKWLRPVDNVLDICVYRLEDPARSCTLTTQYVFDAA